MSSGSAPTVLARMSLVSTSHSLSRLGYCCSELLLRGTPPEPALTALPPIDLEQPVSTSSALINIATTVRIEAVISSSQSTGEQALWLYRRVAGKASG